MKKVKRIIAVCLVVLALLSLSSVFVSAGNTVDWEWEKSAGFADRTITPRKAKLDDTSSYIYYQYGLKNPITVTVHGDTTSDRADDTGTNLTLPNRYNNYCNYYSVSPGTERGLQNTVYENGYGYAYLKIVVGYSPYAAGLWSPDSVGNYT